MSVRQTISEARRCENGKCENAEIAIILDAGIACSRSYAEDPSDEDTLFVDY